MSAARYRTFPRCALVALSLLGASLTVAAQDAARDPTVAPPDSGTAVASPAGTEGMTVLVRDDKPYLVVGSRLYAPGDKVGNLRVERITEKEIWFHDGSTLIKVPRFAGIERKSIIAKPVCAASARQTDVATIAKPPASKGKFNRTRAKHGSPASAPPSAVAVVPCEDAQP